ncbi:MAG: OsmC family protein [Vulcanimicrobiaceae bacterium]
MNISARVTNAKDYHSVSLHSDAREQSLSIRPKDEGYGSSINGGELLFLALATCYCNDIYREAKKRGIDVSAVEVEVSGAFGGEGEGARDIRYSANVTSSAPRAEVSDLMRHTDTVAEIQNTLRSGVAVELVEFDVHVSNES